MAVASSFQLLVWSVLLGGIALFAGSARAAPGGPPVGTWHVLVHYQRTAGPHPERWLWEERVWVIEPAEEGLDAHPIAGATEDIESSHVEDVPDSADDARDAADAEDIDASAEPEDAGERADAGESADAGDYLQQMARF